MKPYILLLLLTIGLSCHDENVVVNPLSFVEYTIDGQNNFNLKNASVSPEIRVSFSAQLHADYISGAVALFDNTGSVAIDISTDNNDSTLVIVPQKPLSYLTKYDLIINNQLTAKNGSKLFSAIQSSFTTTLDMSDKFPRIADDALLELVQKQTFKYFWDFGHPVSGLSRERNTSGDLVTSGGSGFGVMSIVIGVERAWISRQEGLDRLLKIVDFLKNKTERFHGMYPHWLNGATGKVIPFSQKDDGGDIVETSYLIAGLLCVSTYFNQNDPSEVNLRQMIREIWETVEWNWHTKANEKVLYWHWSPKYNWEMNHQLRGWNEALITYILAASSPTYPISKDVYDDGWAIKGNIKNGRSYYGIKLPLGPELGGPLFFAHYSFLGIDPRKLKDSYADYWEQVVNHTLINYNYCKANPRSFSGYSAECWGLTASDTNNGYDAHSPTNDKGVVSPTAALSSLPYTPNESLAALRFFYYKLGDKIFKQFGFTDAFNLHNIWFADSFLAIDQGPIVVMTENYRSGLIWNLTMKNEDIKKGLDKLGFVY